MEAEPKTRLNLKTALKLFFSFSIGVWIQALISFFSIPIITHLISPEEFGKATMYSTAYSLLLMTILVGSDQSFIRFFYEMEGRKRAELLWSCLSIPLLLLLPVSFVLLYFNPQISILLVGESGHRLGILISLSLFTGILQVFNLSLIRMQKKGFLYSTVYVIQIITNLGVTILYAILFAKNFYAIVWGQIFANVIAFLVGFIFEHSHTLPVRVNKKLLKSILSYGLPLLPSTILWWLFTWISRISLRMFANFTELGYFSAAFRLSNIMYLVYSGFQNFWIPVAYETYEKDRENTRLFEETSEIITSVMAIFALMILLLKDLIFYLIAKEYSPASYVLPFLLLPPLVLAILAVTARGINFVKKTYWFIVSDGVSVILNFLGNVLLIPKLGARGSAISTGVSFIALFTIETLVSKKLFPVKYPLSKIYTTLVLLLIPLFVTTFSTNKILTYLSIFLSILLIAINHKNLIRKGVNTFVVRYRKVKGL